MNSSKRLCIIILLLIAVSYADGAEKQNPENFIGYWEEKDGLADPKTNPNVKKAYKIFDKIVAVADKRGTRTPYLKVINSKGDPWAVSLPDGYVVLSKRAVDM